MALRVVNSSGYRGKLTVAKPQPQRKLTVAKPKPQPKLKVVRNTGMQGSTYNPQKTVSSRRIQGSSRPVNVQGGNVNAKTLQGGNASSVQRAATAAQIQAAAEAKRRAIAAEVARQKEQRRKEVQGQVDKRVDTNKSAFKLAASKMKWGSGQLKVGQPFQLPKIKLPEQSEYRKAYVEAYKQALSSFDKQRQPGQMNWLQKGWDKVSLGQDRRDMAARSWAAEQAQKISKDGISKYENNLDKFLKEQATRKADIEKRKFGSKAEFDKAVKTYTDWENQNINALEGSRAQVSGSLAAHGKQSESKLTSRTARAAGTVGNWLDKVGTNPIWKYTLGEGSKNIPSVVTAPSRAVNWLGNLNTQDRDIHQYGGSNIKRGNEGLNAWQATHNQRNFNIKPVTDKEFNYDQAIKEIQGGRSDSLADRSQFAYALNRASSKQEKEKIARKYWDNRNRAARWHNSGKELAADPLMAIGGFAAKLRGVKSAGNSTKLAESARTHKATAWAMKALDNTSTATKALKSKVAQNRAVQWLGKEHLSPEQQLADAIDAARKVQGGAQSNIIDRVNEINRKLSGNQKLDTSVFDELKQLTGNEGEIIQRMVNGKLSARDRLFLAGKNNAPIREKLEGIASKWQDFSEQMRRADNVQRTRFGKGKKTYSPRTAWIDELDDYNFRLKRKGGIQSTDDFKRGAVDRYFKSDFDSSWSNTQNASKSKLVTERDALLKNYDQKVEPAREAVRAAHRRTKSPINRARKAITSPNRLWKKSVLKYRPAWTVNNVLYNTQAAYLAGGGKALKEQAKMVRPKYWRKAMYESRAKYGSDLGKEIGQSGKLNKFYKGVEDWSRVAAGRANEAKGLSPEQALKRVDKYLYSYKTKNWERPLKSVVPFWAWHKNLAKAGAQMPFDRPAAAIGYNRLDKYQRNQYDKEFAQMVPELEKLGYSKSEIEKMKEEQSKYYRGRLKVGNKWITTPFNAFSDKGMSELGFNPFISAAGEAANAKDSWGQKVQGKNATFASRVLNKFPHYTLGNKSMQSWQVNTGRKKPAQGWIAEKGSQGYGLTKEKQGHDPSKPNYVRSMDPRAKLGQDALAMAGVPRGLEFDKAKFVESKKLQKATSEYFSTNWKDMDYPTQEKKQKELFDKFGMSADDFFKGVLARYDTAQTTQIKGMKEAAAKANKSLFEEYSKQPRGTRGRWAMAKLEELNKKGHFDKNPFLKSFDWLNPEGIAKTKTGIQKQKDYEYAKRTGDWSKWRAKYGVKSEKARLVQEALRTGDWTAYRKKFGNKPSAKALAYRKAKKSGDWSGYSKRFGTKSEKATIVQAALKSGDWSEYRKRYGSKQSPHQHDGKFFKSEESMQRYKEGKFWKEYSDADRAERKRMLAKNPQYNTRKDWTRKQWDDWKAEQKDKVRGWSDFAKIEKQFIAQHKKGADPVKTKKLWNRRSLKNVKWA